MTVEEIKQKIMLRTPMGKMVKYDPGHRQKRWTEVLLHFDDSKEYFTPARAGQCFYEALHRQTGRTTDTIIEALSLMSEGVTVFVSTGNNYRIQENIVDNLRRYSRQLDITMRYDKKDPEITLLDAIIDDMKFMDANRLAPNAPDNWTYELTFTQCEGAKERDNLELFSSRESADRAIVYLKSLGDNLYDFNVRVVKTAPKTFDEWYKEMENVRTACLR